MVDISMIQIISKPGLHKNNSSPIQNPEIMFFINIRILLPNYMA